MESVNVSGPAGPAAGNAGFAFDADLACLAVVTVSYNPDLELLGRQLDQLPAGALKLVVDNASRSELRSTIRRTVEERGASLLQNLENRGLPAALNQGVHYAQNVRPACRLVLLLDQDTEPGSKGVERLVASYAPAAALSDKPCCIGPRLVDVETGLDHGFHQIRGWRWSRSFPPPGSSRPVPLANLNGSGTLIPVALFNELGGLEEDFFIDHVDTEWAFRVLAAGYGLYGIPGVTFGHRMGERSLRFWWMGWRLWPYRSPLRSGYLFRNAMWLMKRGYVPTAWKWWAVVKLVLTVVVHLLFDSQRVPQVAAMCRGAWSGLRTSAGSSEGECRERR
ncbi:MAG TPA: glycosyltransferase family 2 protein [Rhodanobacter sp.]|jgi:rhamnosyltransferase|nr:glycosyltransferase family 2 protein [Rhodanobacter sp.]